MVEKKDKWFGIPSGEYKGQFLISLAMAVHCDVLDPAELSYWFDNNWTQLEMTKTMFERVKASRE